MHLTVITSTRRWRDWFRLRLWVRCWMCVVEFGPYVDRGDANKAAEHARTLKCPAERVFNEH